MMVRWPGRPGMNLNTSKGEVRCIFARLPFTDLPETSKTRLSPKELKPARTGSHTTNAAHSVFGRSEGAPRLAIPDNV